MKNNKRIWVLVLLIILAAIGVFFVYFVDTEEAAAPNQTISDELPEEEPEIESGDNAAEATVELTASEVATHDSESDCWTIIDGTVYDITDYIPNHPGGDEILRACGADGTSLFNERTTEDGETVGSGTAHSSSAQSQLGSFEVGALVTE